MKKGVMKGFTIIEVTLFLAITGLIMSVMLVGISNGINQERYRDASTSVLGFFQGQYSSTINVSNQRAKDQPCVGVGSDAGRGTSDCFIVGRIISSTASGDAMTSRAVYATNEYAAGAPAIAGKSDGEILLASGLQTSSQIDTYSMEWGTRLITPSDPASGVRSFTLLIVRMPTSGIVHTYLADGVGKTPNQVLSPIPPRAPSGVFRACIESAGLIKAAQGYVGVQIANDASNSSGVKSIDAGAC